jgi:hypothetical protein
MSRDIPPLGRHNTAAGTGRIALRAGRKPGRLRIVADGVALKPGETEIELTLFPGPSRHGKGANEAED